MEQMADICIHIVWNFEFPSAAMTNTRQNHSYFIHSLQIIQIDTGRNRHAIEVRSSNLASATTPVEREWKKERSDGVGFEKEDRE